MWRYITAAGILLSCSGCTNESIVVGPNEPAAMTIRSVVPASGTPGDFVTIHGTKFSELRFPYPVSFNGALAWLEDYSDSVLTVRVPPDASTGSLRVLAPDDSATGPVFTVQPSCGRDACVKLYGGPPLTEQQSWTLNCFFR